MFIKYLERMIIIPYDLFAGLLMLPMFVILLILVLVAVRQRNVSKKKVIPIAVLIVILIGIPSVGHTEWNRHLQLKNALHTFQADDYLPDAIAPEFIQTLQNAPRPLQVQVISSAKDSAGEPNQVYDTVIQVEGDRYKVRLASYTYPLSWSPYETWVIESIQKQ